MSPELHKCCTGCSVTKPRAEFFPSAFTADGLTDNCRPCVFANARRDCEERERRLTARQCAVSVERRA